MPTPSELAEAVLEAAEKAGMGVTVSTLINGEARILYMSPASSQLVGLPPEQMKAGSAFDSIAPEAQAQAREHARRLRAGEPVGVLETVLALPDGGRRQVMSATGTAQLSGQPAVVTFLWDNTAKKLAESRLHARDQSFRMLIEGAPDGVVISRMGTVLYANPAAARMLGYPGGEQLVGVRMDAFLSPEDVALMRERLAKQASAREPLAPQVYRARRLDGTEVAAEITSLPFEFEGQPAVLGFARDVTERLALEERLSRSNRLSALGTLAAGVAHEVNNPLGAMSLAAEALEQLAAESIPQPAAKEQALTLVRELRRNVSAISTIVKDLSAYGRDELEGEQPVALEPVVQAALRVTAHATRHAARVRCESGEPLHALGRPRRLEQVLVNLLLNAAHAFPTPDPRNEICVGTRRLPDGRVELEVRDNGVGIPAEVLPRIFDPFFTTKPVGEGTGLGLFISHQLISQVGGELTISSTPGAGTRARVVLRAAPTAAAPPPLAAPAPARRGARLLLVDDSPSMLFTLKALLGERHAVTTACGAAEALALLRSDVPFDLVLCDVMMPGVSGVELYQRLRAERPDRLARFAFMTGGASSPETARFLEQPFILRLSKPFTAAQVEHLLSQVLPPLA